MNKTKKQKAFNISLIFGVLALLFACIFASFFVDTPNVLAYTDSSYECSLISYNKEYDGSGFYNETMGYDVGFYDDHHTAFFRYNYKFTHSLEFDSFLFSICNYDGNFDAFLGITPFYYSINVAIEGHIDADWAIMYPIGSMINFIRPDDEYKTFFNDFDTQDIYGYGTYLINFNSSQEILNQGMITVIVMFDFGDRMTAQQWTNYKTFTSYARYKNTANIQILEPGVINPDGSYNQGYEVGYNKGVNLSNQAQYDKGYSDGVQAGGNIGSWLAGIGEAPLTLIKSLFNIEVFGINLNTIVFSLLGALVVIKLIRLFI